MCRHFLFASLHILTSPLENKQNHRKITSQGVFMSYQIKKLVVHSYFSKKHQKRLVLNPEKCRVSASKPWSLKNSAYLLWTCELWSTHKHKAGLCVRLWKCHIPRHPTSGEAALHGPCKSSELLVLTAVWLPRFLQPQTPYQRRCFWDHLKLSRIPGINIVEGF